jgi:hypothetical protein
VNTHQYATNHNNYNTLKEIVIMAKSILSKESYTLKLSNEDSKNLIRFCIISVPIYDAVNSILEQMKTIEPYIEEWQVLEKPVSEILRKLK